MHGEFFKVQYSRKNCLSKALMNSYILCKILSFLTRVAQKSIQYISLIFVGRVSLAGYQSIHQAHIRLQS